MVFQVSGSGLVLRPYSLLRSAVGNESLGAGPPQLSADEFFGVHCEKQSHEHFHLMRVPFERDAFVRIVVCLGSTTGGPACMETSTLIVLFVLEKGRELRGSNCALQNDL